MAQCARPYLESVLPRPAAKAAAAALLSKCDHREHSEASSDDDEGIDLCNCEFSLAYGEGLARLSLLVARNHFSDCCLDQRSSHYAPVGSVARGMCPRCRFKGCGEI